MYSKLFGLVVIVYIVTVFTGVFDSLEIYGQSSSSSDFYTDDTIPAETIRKPTTKKNSKQKSKSKNKSTRYQDNVTDNRDYTEGSHYKKSSSQNHPFFSQAVGGGINWMLKKEYGEVSQKKVIPELSVLSYFNIYDPFFLKHSLRLGYSWMKPQMPQALQVREDEFIILSDIGALYNWYVVPSLYIGCGTFYRKTKLYTKEPIYIEQDLISDSEWVFVLYGQFGVATPVLKDTVVLEPFIRFLSVKNDDRIRFSFGAELSYYLFKRW